MPGFLSPRKGELLLIPEYSGINKGQRFPDRSKTAHRKPLVKCILTKWALGSITRSKASGSDGILAELFQILEDDAIKMFHSTCQQIWKAQQWLWDWKRSVFIQIPNKGNAKECSNCHAIVLISFTY